MKQYLKLLKKIKKKGTLKTAARENMPSTTSLFGYQLRHNLKDGFPLLTTKKLSFKNIVTELLWFLRGDTNVKYLIDNGCNIWNEDAYNYYVKLASGNSENWNPVMRTNEDGSLSMFTYEQFVEQLKMGNLPSSIDDSYKLGDCGFQYGRVWRNWEGVRIDDYDEGSYLGSKIQLVDQIANVVNNLKNNPQSRRHLVTAIDPANDTNLALYWCHSLFQFNCRPLTSLERSHYAVNNALLHRNELMFPSEYEDKTLDAQLDEANVPKYYLDCQMYQRSADVFLGVPYNIASYALLNHIIAKICNMIPGDYIHTFGDVHIYDNHIDQVDEQLSREPKKLPKLSIRDEGNDWAYIRNTLDFSLLDTSDFHLENYEAHPRIKAKLSTGLK